MFGSLYSDDYWNSNTSTTKCECGSDVTFGDQSEPFHSSWCPKFKKPIDNPLPTSYNIVEAVEKEVKQTKHGWVVVPEGFDPWKK